ncbi:pilus assembly protein TadG-related protein [Streptomyces sp. 4N509B]|uniref:pilus assembly protein TadG-related protein n=1 Tax=Streptomyces sp. 4N509B TaxID=3457413 RepID=UPI003FD0555C
MFPLYVWMVTGLLGVAFLFFVFAQAAVVASDAQSAADAAAIAAAQEASEELRDGFVDAIGDGGGDEDSDENGDEDEDGDPDDSLGGTDLQVGDACEEAERLAALNDADVVDCGLNPERTGFTVIVRTQNTVGDSLIPGTEDETAQARATALIHGLCEMASEEEDQIELECGEDSDDDISFDPGDEDDLPDARDLFRVYLDD